MSAPVAVEPGAVPRRSPLNQRPFVWPSSLRWFVLVAVAYAAGAQLAFSWFGADGTNASFFPAAGVTLGALVIAAKRDWPAILVAAGVAELAVDLWHDIDLAPTLGYVLANLAQPVLGALLLRRFTRDVDLSRSRDLFLFVLCGPIAAALLGGIVGATNSVVIDGGDRWLRFVFEWWVGDGLGILVIAPLILDVRWWPRKAGIAGLVESAALVAGVTVATAFVFGAGLFGLASLVVALMMATAVRARTTGVVVAGALASLLAGAFTASGDNDWITRDSSPDTALMYFQIAVAVVLMTALALAAEINERERAVSAATLGEQARLEERKSTERAELLRDLAEAMASARTTSEVIESAALLGFELEVDGSPSISGSSQIRLVSPDPIVRDTALTLVQHGLARAAIRERDALLSRVSDVMERSTTVAGRGRALADLLHAERGWAVTLRIPGHPPIRSRWATSPTDPPASAEDALMLPLQVRNYVVGELQIWPPDGAPPVLPEVATAIAERAAMALDNARLFEREKAVSHHLQVGLLGGPLPVVVEFELEASYHPASDDIEVGGDWYDAFLLPSGRLAVVIGDVVGHGLEAALAMGQLRSAVRTVAPFSSPKAVLERLDDYVAAEPSTQYATLFYAELDPSSGTLCYAAAGHPPPLVFDADRRTRFIWAARSAPLGVRNGEARLEASDVLRSGDVLLLYTDGLVERRGATIDEGLYRLAAAAQEAGAQSPRSSVRRVVSTMLADAAGDDDACVLAIAARPRRAGFSARLLAAPEHLAPMRHALSRWLASQTITDREHEEILLVVSEAATNAVDHGCGSDGTSPVDVVAAIDDHDKLLVVVRDGGRWRRESPGPNRGRGIVIMRALMDRIDVESTPGGTEVRLYRTLRARPPGDHGSGEPSSSS